MMGETSQYSTFGDFIDNEYPANPLPGRLVLERASGIREFTDDLRRALSEGRILLEDVERMDLDASVVTEERVFQDAVRYLAAKGYTIKAMHRGLGVITTERDGLHHAAAITLESGASRSRVNLLFTLEQMVH